MRWMVVVLILTCILRFDQGEFRKVIGFSGGRRPGRNLSILWYFKRFLEFALMRED